MLVPLLLAFAFPAALATPGGVNVAAGDVLLVVAGVAWLARLAVAAAPAPLLRGNPLAVPALLFAGYSVASLAWSTDAPATAKAAVQMVQIVVFTSLLFATLPASVARLRRALEAFVGLTSAMAFVAVVAFAAGGASSPTYLPGLHKNAAGGYIGVGLVLAFTLALDRRGPHRGLLALACVVEIAGLAATYSRGAIAGSLLSLAVVTLLLRRARTITLVLTVAGCVLLALTIASSVTAGPIRSDGGFDSAAVRVVSYARGLDWIERHPLLGTGAGTYLDYIPELNFTLPDPNNLFLLTWAELGVGGALVLLLLLYRCTRLLARARRLAPEGRVVAVAAGGAALSLLIHFQFDVTWNRGSATLCFALLGLLAAAGRLAPARVGAHPPLERPVQPEPTARPLRVLHLVSSSGFHGIERHVVDLVAGLRRLDCDAAIACPPGARRLRREAEARGVDVVPPTGSAIPLAAAVLADARRRRPDVVHVHDGLAAALGWRVASASGARLVRTQHFVEPASMHRSGWRRTASLAIHRAINQDAAALVAVSRSVAEAARERADRGAVDPIVIPAGVVLPDEDEVEQLVAARRNAPPLLAAVGRLEREKSYPLLLSALALARERVPDLRLLVVGDGSLGDELRELARTLGVDDAVEWAGAVEAPWSEAAAARVFVHPAAAEPHGLATAEAMARALPVVGVAAGGTAELVVDGETGLLVRADDASAFAGAIVRLAEDAELAESLGRAGRRRAADALGIDATARTTLELYGRLA